jgi:hypothetical protein
MQEDRHQAGGGRKRRRRVRCSDISVETACEGWGTDA